MSTQVAPAPAALAPPSGAAPARVSESSTSSSSDGLGHEKQPQPLPSVGGKPSDTRKPTTSKPCGKAEKRNDRATVAYDSDTDSNDSSSNLHATSAAPKRWKTFLRAFRHIAQLTPKEVDDFMNSYVIYNLDWSDTTAMEAALGPDYHRRVGDCLRAYYGVLNHLCALGAVEKMYIPPFMSKKASVLDNQLLYERSIARDIGLRPGMRVLDLGCGRGRVAAHMSQFTGARITGINIDGNQVAQAREFTAARGLNNDFIEQDFNALPLPFADGEFDAFYQIQALSLCKDIRALFREVYRVVKPGARISSLDWVKYPAYDPQNPEHAALMRRVKPLIGAVGTPTPASLEEDLAAAGFQVMRSDNASLGGLQAPLIATVDHYFRAMRQVILGGVKLHVFPGHFKTLINRFCQDGEAFVKMDTERLITTSYRIIAIKPAVPKQPAEPEPGSQSEPQAAPQTAPQAETKPETKAETKGETETKTEMTEAAKPEIAEEPKKEAPEAAPVTMTQGMA